MAIREKNFRSPSQVERLFQCPGSALAQEKIMKTGYELPHSPAAVEGTAIHQLAAKCLKEKKNAHEFLGDDLSVDYDGTQYDFVVNDDFVYAVNLYRNTILKILEENNVTEDALQVEIYESVPDIETAKAKKFGGTADCKFISGSTLHVFDLKGGRGIIVDPVKNKQCMSYAIRAVESAGMFVDKVVLWIIQPRAREGEFVKSWETTPETILSFKEELRAQIDKSKDPKAELKAGDECGFCIASATCPALQRGISTAVKPVMNEGFKFPIVRELTPENISKALPGLMMLKEFLSQLEGYAFSMLMRGDKVPGYVLTKTNKHRVWVDEDSAVEFLSKHLGQEEFMTSPKLLTPSQVEELVGKELVKDYITKPEGEYKIAPEKEVTEYVKRSVEEVFKDVKLD